MTTLNDTLQEKLVPLTAAYGALARCRTVPELRQAIRTQEPIVREAELFATSIAHVETSEARQFRDTVNTMRRALEDRKGTLQGVVTPAGVSFVTNDTPKRPEPLANALILSRAEARDVSNNEQAKARAQQEGKELWVED
jgi:hypothetical protein